MSQASLFIVDRTQWKAEQQIQRSDEWICNLSFTFNGNPIGRLHVWQAMRTRFAQRSRVSCQSGHRSWL